MKEGRIVVEKTYLIKGAGVREGWRVQKEDRFDKKPLRSERKAVR
jgi:hypothetical protein